MLTGLRRSRPLESPGAAGSLVVADREAGERCCSCGGPIERPVSSRVACCPACGARMGVESVVIREDFWGLTLRTLGDVRIEAGASAALKRIEASGVVIVRGALRAQVRALGGIRVLRGAYWCGSGEAPSIEVDPEAVIDCYYQSGERSEATRSPGAAARLRLLEGGDRGPALEASPELAGPRTPM